ncbi:MAG: PAS domain-containing protein [Candidatus Omnitrophica bacterium]|nr:PAS domain-containing protein [Candidatus Omnitrophota bacterium]
MFFAKAKKRALYLEQSIKELSANITELEKQNSVNLAILSSMAEGVIAVSKDIKILSINPAVEKVFNIDKKDFVGRFLLEVIPNNDIVDLITISLKNKEHISREIDLVWPVKKNFQVNAYPIFENSVISGCLIVMHDVTELRRLEAMRKDFVANVSHELKTPLTSIKGFVETLLEGALEDKENSRHFLKIIQDHADRLNNLINDLLDLSSFESKESGLDLEEFNLKDFADDVLFGFRAQLKKKDVTLTNDLPADIMIKADKDKIEQVLTNLIDNAIKFNKQHGFVRIYCQSQDDKIKVYVEDSGSGILPKDIPRIFERFYRVDKARSRELGGTGLGLSIVKHIIELHGGSVGVESAEGLGSSFWFTIPK